MYSFIDFSGCVFLNTYSGETLSFGLSESELVKLITSRQNHDNTKTTLDTINTLVDKGFLKSLELKNSNVE